MLSARQEILEDAELLRRARGKDRPAIRLIIQRHNQRLYRIARSIVRNDSEAEDTLQEAYCNAFANLGAFRGESQLGTWLARIVMNEALGRLRRQRPSMELTVLEDSPGLAAQIIPFPGSVPDLDPETAMARSEIRALLERAIDDLPEAFRIVLVARLIEGMSVDETAELFGILPETVKPGCIAAAACSSRRWKSTLAHISVMPSPSPAIAASALRKQYCSVSSFADFREPFHRHSIQRSVHEPKIGSSDGGTRCFGE